jgi:hypothetical protein
MTGPSQRRRAGRIDITVRYDTDANCFHRIGRYDLELLRKVIALWRTAVLYISGYFMFRAGALHLHQITQT